jgi:hypothetical protein
MSHFMSVFLSYIVEKNYFAPHRAEEPARFPSGSLMGSFSSKSSFGENHALTG